MSSSPEREGCDNPNRRPSAAPVWEGPSRSAWSCRDAAACSHWVRRRPVTVTRSSVSTGTPCFTGVNTTSPRICARRSSTARGREQAVRLRLDKLASPSSSQRAPVALRNRPLARPATHPCSFVHGALAEPENLVQQALTGVPASNTPSSLAASVAVRQRR